jgi:hypothetical protein
VPPNVSPGSARGYGSTPANREAGSGSSLPTVDQLIRTAHGILTEWRVEMSPAKVARLCRDYHRHVGGRIPFDRYVHNAASRAARTGAARVVDLDQWQRMTRGFNPTQRTAVANVARERGEF